MTERRIFKRKSGYRDARLIIIATEGQETEKAYFEGLKKHYTNLHVHVEILERISSASDPLKVIVELDHFRSTYNLQKDYDQLWLVIDVDRWGSRKLSVVSQLCAQKNYHLAVSNPAFEIWLLMHINAIDAYSPEILGELLQNKKLRDRTRLEQELINLMRYYNKTNPDMNFFCQHVDTAIYNSRNADKNPEDRWPNSLGTRVYLLVEEIIPAYANH